MSVVAERETQRMAQPRPCAEYDYDLVQELGRRVGMLSRYERYIANAARREPLKRLWQNLRTEDQRTIDLLKQVIKGEM
jgi:hypothetical protein